MNIGEKIIEAVDQNSAVSHAKFQMCRGMGRDKVLASVSRLVQSGHSVVFQDPQKGSYVVLHELLEAEQRVLLPGRLGQEEAEPRGE